MRKSFSQRVLTLEVGFTLIEVLIALAIIAIALSALLKATSQGVSHTEQIKDKSISHWVEMQAVTAFQLGIITINPNQESTHVTNMFGQRWYWRIHSTRTELEHVSKFTVTVSKKITGPFTDPLLAYRFEP